MSRVEINLLKSFTTYVKAWGCSIVEMDNLWGPSRPQLEDIDSKIFLTVKWYSKVKGQNLAWFFHLLKLIFFSNLAALQEVSDYALDMVSKVWMIKVKKQLGW